MAASSMEAGRQVEWRREEEGDDDEVKEGEHLSCT